MLTAQLSPKFVISVPQLVHVLIFRHVEPGVRDIVILMNNYSGMCHYYLNSHLLDKERIDVMNSTINVLTFYRFISFKWDISVKYGVIEIVIFSHS